MIGDGVPPGGAHAGGIAVGADADEGHGPGGTVVDEGVGKAVMVVGDQVVGAAREGNELAVGADRWCGRVAQAADAVEARVGEGQRLGPSSWCGLRAAPGTNAAGAAAAEFFYAGVNERPNGCGMVLAARSAT